MEMDILGIVQQYAIIPVAAACFMVGWLLKNVWAGFPNKYIPLVLLPVGLVGVLWLNAWAITPENIMAGLCSAAVAVYAHTTGKHIAEAAATEKAEPGGDVQ